MQTSQERPVEKEDELLMNGACRVCRGPSKDRLRPVASSEGAPPAGLGTTTATWSNACCPHPVWSSVSEPLTSCRLVQECEADEAAKRVAAGHACKAANQPNETPPDSSTPRPKSRRNLPVPFCRLKWSVVHQTTMIMSRSRGNKIGSRIVMGS